MNSDSPATFDLTTEPWIPCETLSGERVELGLRDVLVRAHELSAIADGSPLATVCLHRLLLAIVHRVIDGPVNLAAWRAAFEPGCFEAERVDGYLARWRHRLDLLHATHPFMQVRGLLFEADEVSSLIEHRARWGGGRELFEHRPDGDEGTLTLAEAARALLVTHAYAAGGLVKKPGEPTSATAAPLRTGLQALIAGKNLFETLSYNLLLYNPKLGRPVGSGGADAPAWEQEPLPQRLSPGKEPVRAPLGWLDLLTWQSRRLELRHERGVVTGVVRAVGQGLSAGDGFLDPLMLRRRDEARGILPVRLQPDRAVWRDLDALLFTAAQGEEEVRPKNVEELAKPSAPKVAAAVGRVPIMLFGMAGYQARVDAVRAEVLPVPVALLNDAARADDIRAALDQAGKLERELGKALYAAAAAALRGAGEADKAEVTALTRTLRGGEHYWAAARLVFEDLLGNQGPPEAVRLAYQRGLLRVARRALQDALEALGESSRHVRAAAKGFHKLSAGEVYRELSAAAREIQAEVMT